MPARRLEQPRDGASFAAAAGHRAAIIRLLRAFVSCTDRRRHNRSDRIRTALLRRRGTGQYFRSPVPSRKIRPGRTLHPESFLRGALMLTKRIIACLDM